MANLLAICLSKMSWRKPSKQGMIVRRGCRRTNGLTVLPEGTLKKLIGSKEAVCADSSESDRNSGRERRMIIPAHSLQQYLLPEQFHVLLVFKIEHRSVGLRPDHGGGFIDRLFAHRVGCGACLNTFF